MASADALSELLIAQLLEEDMRILSDAREAERLQLTQSLADSSRASGRFPKKVHLESVQTDEDIALHLFVEEARFNGDAALAQALQQSADSSAIAGQQLAQKLAAAEKKLMLDAEFARLLQERNNDDDATDTHDIDMLDADSVLGQAVIEQILASDPNDKGKGKGSANNTAGGLFSLRDKQEISGKATEPDDDDDIKVDISQAAPLHPTCGICLENFKPTYSPIMASQSANSSAKLPFGLYLPCPKSHPYCGSCLQAYIMSKLDPGGDGSGNASTDTVFPIRCPECSLLEWADGILDEIATKILSQHQMNIWHQQKLLDSMPRHYCPNPRCSALVQLHDDPDEPQAQCPACQSLMCVPCRVIWHADMSCEEYQALPLDERSPEDQQALQLMKAQNWRRCPHCSIIVELTVGCNHITCRCKTEFCFKCGSLWDTRRQRCTLVPSCELWDDEMLLEERERNRERQARVLAPVPQAAPPPALFLGAIDREAQAIAIANQAIRQHAQEERQVYHYNEYVPPQARDLTWMHDDDIISKRHWFTIDMIQTLSCGYCDAKLRSVADLRYHLANTKRHELYACCGRFFKRDVDFERHVESAPRQFGRHVHQLRRDLVL
ncbi:hypothetical protein QCA50_013382 [Cerrena zonata]|uniref:RBR-type E3 ubiquitin transferase n=1 Tax=Cerrena zonata TaxID=2478898 RepID=A0AAW0G1W9_9APHY